MLLLWAVSTHPMTKAKEPSQHKKKYQHNKCFYLVIYFHRQMSPLMYFAFIRYISAQNGGDKFGSII